jgi:nitrite reductase (NADH) small subunit
MDGSLAASTRARRQIDVCPLEELPEGARRIVDTGRREVAVFNVRGELYALPNVCSHQLGPLCEGKITGTLVASEETGWVARWEYDGEVITCPWHGLEFHIKTGRCLAHPEVRLRSYEVLVEDGMVKLVI